MKLLVRRFLLASLFRCLFGAFEIQNTLRAFKIPVCNGYYEYLFLYYPRVGVVSGTPGSNTPLHPTGITLE